MSKSAAQYLAQFDDLPDLHQLAREKSRLELYAIQDALREEYRAKGLPFKWSMPLRHYGHCHKCDQKFTQVLYELENPPQHALAKTNSSHIHAVREHGVPLDATIKTFLDSIA